MGNLCSKSSNQPDNFAGQGRVVGSSTTRSNAPASAPIPPQVSSSSPGRTTGQGQGSSLDAADARSAAARAAEERAKAQPAGTSGGKLSSNLEAQKKQTRNALLASGSEQEQQVRAADAATEARNYN